MTPARDREQARRSTFRGNPFWLFGPRPIREERLRAYIHRQHRAGRPLSEILFDRELEELGGRTLTWRVVMSPLTIEVLRADACGQIRSCMDSARRLGA